MYCINYNVGDKPLVVICNVDTKPQGIYPVCLFSSDNLPAKRCTTPHRYSLYHISPGTCIIDTLLSAVYTKANHNIVSAARHLHVGMTSIQNGGYFWLKTNYRVYLCCLEFLSGINCPSFFLLRQQTYSKQRQQRYTR